jgi:nucleotide-binding universal stress UspA family protein
VAQRVLVGFDGSPASQAALAHAARQAQRHHGRLDVVMVLQDTWTHLAGATGVSAISAHELETALIEELRAAVATLPEDVSVCWLAVHGSVARTLAAQAASRACDAIVVGAPSGLWSRMTGGIARELRHRTTIPVVVIGTPAPWRTRTRRPRGRAGRGDASATTARPT